MQAAKLGKRVAVIERRGTLGGACVDTGTIPSKTLREAVLWTQAANARAQGMSPTRATAALASSLPFSSHSVRHL